MCVPPRSASRRDKTPRPPTGRGTLFGSGGLPGQVAVVGLQSRPALRSENATATSVKIRPRASGGASRIVVASKLLTTQLRRASAIYVATLCLAVEADLNFTTDVTLLERAFEPATYWPCQSASSDRRQRCLGDGSAPYFVALTLEASPERGQRHPSLDVANGDAPLRWFVRKMDLQRLAEPDKQN